jgi:hypothetical protein
MRITHLNHASLLVETPDGHSFLLDPWLISPAFDNWTQHPYPAAKTTRKLLEISPRNLSIVISHGHDDHIDEFVISKSFSRSDIFIPKLRTNGLFHRVSKLTTGKVIEVDGQGVECGGTRLFNFINGDFTGDDTIFVLRTNDAVCIHANDNWHAYRQPLVESLKACWESLPEANILYFVQLGNADSFPLGYPGYSDAEALEELHRRYRRFRDFILINTANLGLKEAYTYANQARFETPVHRAFTSADHDCLKAEYIASANNLTQLHPGDWMEIPGRFTPSAPHEQDLLDFCLSNYLKNFKAYMQDKGITFWSQNLAFSRTPPSHPPEATSVMIQASELVWSKILSGLINIEAIIIGGCGMIYKSNDVNISELHHLLMKWTYRAQKEIRENGLHWFFAKS